MVRFTLEYPMNDSRIKMDLPPTESMQELNETVRDYWGGENVRLIRGYELLDDSRSVGEILREGDVVEAIPFPKRMSRNAS